MSAAALAPGRSRTPTSGRLVMATARLLLANGGLSRIRGCAVVVVAGTILSSKTAIPVTRNDSGTVSAKLAAPVLSLRIPISRSVPPARRCSRSAVC